MTPDAPKTKLSRLIELAEKGEEVVITRRGKPVARLVPETGVVDRERARRAVEDIIETGKGLSLGGLSIKDLINEGRP